MRAPGSVSVVVCTHGDRHAPLERLIAALSWQTLPFELVIVIGPATRATRVVVDRLTPEVRRVDCRALNISRARNVGVCAAAGDIVVFIDDDAVPAGAGWLEHLIAPFTRISPANGKVAAVGGTVYQAETDIVEFAGGATSATGFQRSGAGETPGDAACGTWTARIPGGNCAISRRALENVGGFDEQFADYLGEADLCVRLVAAGYRIEYTADAPTRHFAAASAHERRAHHRRYLVARSDAYFVMRHGPGSLSHRARLAVRNHPSKSFIREGRARVERGGLTTAAVLWFRLNCWSGLVSGICAALVRAPALTPGGLPRTTPPQPYASRRIVILDPGPDSLGGDSVWHALASWGAQLQRAGDGLAVTVVSGRIDWTETAGVASMAPPHVDRGPDFDTPTLARLSRAANEAAHWIDVLRRLRLVPALHLVVWPGCAYTGALIEEGLGRRVALVSIPGTRLAESPGDVVRVADRSDAFAGSTSPRLTSSEQVVSALDGAPIAVRPPQTPLASTLAGRAIVESFAMNGNAMSAASLAISEPGAGEAALTTLRYCVRDGDHELAVALGTSLRGHLVDDRLAVEVDYQLAGALYSAGRADDARQLYEGICQHGGDGGDFARFRAGACFHLAVEAHAVDQSRRAERLLVDCLALMPEHGAARRLLDTLRMSSHGR